MKKGTGILIVFSYFLLIIIIIYRKYDTKIMMKLEKKMK